MISITDRFAGCLLGLACGDAVGTTLEFKARGTFQPISDLVGGGPFNLQAGEWTDDTSMALCLAHSLLEKKAFDPADQMERYLNWMTNGYLSSNGVCFDIGSTVSAALGRYEVTKNPYSGSTHEMSAGNGSIMRLAPIPLFYFPDQEKTIRYAGESSKTTHGAAACVEACKLFAAMLHEALQGKSKTDILKNHGYTPTDAKIAAIAMGDYFDKTREQIRGSGYVVDSLEAALWCFYQTESYKDAILLASNLGEDTDTTAAVCGQIAGAYYGKAGIPKKWLAKVVMGPEIEALAIRLGEFNGVI